MSGGGGGGGHTQYDWNDTMAPIWTSTLGKGQALAQTPYQQYPGQRIADITPDQRTAMQNIRAYASDPTYGVIDPNNAQNAGIMQEGATLTGQYLNGPKANPYGSDVNPYAGKSALLQSNQYAGMDSPYFKSTVQSGLGDMAQAYQQGTAADLNRAATLGGVVGGSAYNNAQGANQYALAKQMSNYVSGMQNDQYNRSAGLQENAIGRDMSNQQYGLSSGQNAYESMFGRGNSDFENERNRQIGVLSPTQNEQPLALQRQGALMSVGDMNRAYNQDNLNLGYQNFQDAKQYPYTQMDFLTNLLSRAQGGIGSNVSTQTSGYSASPFSSILGGALLGSQFFG